MYEINGYIIWYDTKCHKWSIRKNGIEVIKIGNIKEVKKWCKENKENEKSN